MDVIHVKSQNRGTSPGGGPVVKIPCFQGRDCGFSPLLENRSHVSRDAANK